MVTISETIAPGIVMANARLCYMDNGESKVNRDTMNDHCGLGKAVAHSDSTVEVVKPDQGW
jgi:hypothetical protein